MNAEQLHATCLEIRKEIDALNLVDELQQLSTALQNSVNQPNQPAYQEQVGVHRDKLIASLAKVEANERSVVKRQIIEEIGGSELLGGALRARIEESFSQFDVTPALVQKDVAEMHVEIEGFREGLDQLVAGFTRLDIQAEELEGYVAELAILIPRRENADDLKFFSKDLQKLNQELQNFHELVTGQAGQFRIRSLSSSDYSVFLQFLPETAQSIVSTIALLLLGYEKLLDIRKKRAELAENDAPEPLIEEMDKWAESIMSEKIDEITSDLMKQFKDVKRPSGRANELEGHVRISVKKVAGRLDMGYHFSARIGNIDEPPEDELEDEDVASEYERKTSLISDVKANASTLEYRTLEGEPVLPLSWRPSDDDQDEDV